MNEMIIAIDGPSGSGKSTLGRMLARALKLLYVDTGSMYRAVALAVIEAQLDPNDTEAVTALANEIDIDLKGDPDSLKVSLNGRDVTEQIRTDDVTVMSSIISSIPGVRRAMVAQQRALGRRGAVLNGRDIGTVVFPEADIKFFLTAAQEERAERRFKEDQISSGSSATLAQTLAEMVERDNRDSTRADSPLRVADDAIVVDSSGKTIGEVFELMMDCISNVHWNH
jgi:cytidylate kinase